MQWIIDAVGAGMLAFTSDHASAFMFRRETLYRAEGYETSQTPTAAEKM